MKTWKTFLAAAVTLPALVLLAAAQPADPTDGAPPPSDAPDPAAEPAAPPDHGTAEDTVAPAPAGLPPIPIQEALPPGFQPEFLPPTGSGFEPNDDSPFAERGSSAPTQAADGSPRSIPGNTGSDAGSAAAASPNRDSAAGTPTAILGSGAAPATANANAIPPTAASEIRMNFRNAPLDMVLNHLSEAAGFIIVLETDVRGKVDAWSNQPMTSDEAVAFLSAVLAKQGYAVIRDGRTLTILSRDEARKRDLPVRTGADPELIPKSEEIVTQIIPVRFISATSLVRDLQPLLPAEATLTANEGGNALVITDTQSHIRRLAEIIRALDTAISSVSRVKVFSLQYADAKELATVIKDLFATDTTRNQNAGPGGARFMNFMRGGGQGGAPTDTSGGRAPTVRVVATSDDRSNSLVVSAPEEQMPIIEEIVQRVDTNVEDVTELRVFRLKFADPQETADLLTSLFPDTTSTQNTRNRAIQFGGRFGGPPGMNAGSSSESRVQRQNRVLAVPDARTRSVVVSASRELLEQITPMIQQLDADPSKNQKVFVIPVENTDPTAVEEILRGLFEGQNSRNRTSTSRNTSRQTGNQLNTRATQNQNQRTTSTGFGNSSAFGNANR